MMRAKSFVVVVVLEMSAALLLVDGVVGSEREGVAAIETALADCDRSQAAVVEELGKRTSLFAKLEQLRAEGHATWREVAEERVRIESLEGARRATDVLADFCRACLADCGEFETQTPSGGFDEARCELMLARRQATAGLRVAELEVWRNERLLSALEALVGLGHATATGVNQARERVAGARAVFGRVTKELANGQEADEVLGEDLSQQTKFVGRRLELRKIYCAGRARQAAVAARIAFQTELVERLNEADREINGRREELELARLDLEWLRAMQADCGERLRVVEAEEGLLFAYLIERPRDVLPAITGWLHVDTADWPMIAGRGASEWRPGRLVVLGVKSQESSHTAREVSRGFKVVEAGTHWVIGEPSYADYYAFGNRRTDAPPAARNWFRNGDLPWYLPGSTTNFK